MSNSNESILDEAKRLVRGDRNEFYGPPIEDFECQAEMLTAYFKRKGTLAEGKVIEAVDIAPIMILIKMAREAHRHKRDNFVDTAGYSDCGEMVWETHRHKRDNFVGAGGNSEFEKLVWRTLDG